MSEPKLEWRDGPLAGYEVSTDLERLDVEVLHGFLVEAEWSRGVPRAVLLRSLAHSLCFGLYAPGGAQAGFARVVSDRAVFAYLGDVFVLPEHRRGGLAIWLVRCVLAHPELQGLRRWYLATEDAHGLYARFGFVTPKNPSPHMFLERSPEELYGPEADPERR
jgi:GNAT superfamily N-acetyltransferase